MKKFLPYLGRRAIFILPQIFGVLVITFLFVRLIPGDPASLMGGPLMPEEGIELIREKMGLKGSLPVQFVHYIKNVIDGNLGYSWYTGNRVIEDIKLRLPATLELIFLTIIVVLVVVLPISIKSVAIGAKGYVKKFTRRGLFVYGMSAGAFPDFWLALVMIFVFYATFRVLPAPVGPLDIGILTPPRVTGMILFDSLLTGHWEAAISSLKHLILPVFCLAFVAGGPTIKIALVTSMAVQKSNFVDFAKVSGLSTDRIQSYVTRMVFPSVATITAVTFGYLIGGAVLVETVFSWGGFGQYAVQSIINSDYAAIQGVVLVSALLNLAIYMLVDMIYFFVDPRIKSLG